MTDAARRIRIGVIGAGTISQSVHFASLRRAGFEVAAVCDASPSRAAEVAALLGTRGFTDPAEVLGSDVDAVLIATPGSHAQLAAAAIRAGKHVLAEKPLAFTVGEVDELERLAAEQRVVTQVGYMKMFDPLVETAAAELAEYRDTRLVRITVSHPADDPQVSHLRMGPAPHDADPEAIRPFVDYDSARAREALPGATEPLTRYYADVLNGSIIHEFSLLRALGLPLPTRWSAELLGPLGAAEPPSLLAHARVGDTAYLLNWNWLPDHPEYHEELAVLAANGRLEFSLAKPYLLEARSRLRSQRHEGELRRDTTYTSGHETGFLRQLDAFAAAIRTGRTNAADLAGVKTDIRQLQLLARAVAENLGESIGIEDESLIEDER
ncbi:Gfo/Idh/MocA family protein [Naumannella huperziae]